MSFKVFLKQAKYRVWQFFKAVNPRLDNQAWDYAYKKADASLQPLLSKLGKAEKAHTLRVLNLIESDTSLGNNERQELLDFALIHDIGKAITKPTLVFKVAKILFKLNGNAHCIAGAKAVWHLTHNKQLALRILHHHLKSDVEPFITKFQTYDDRA